MKKLLKKALPLLVAIKFSLASSLLAIESQSSKSEKACVLDPIVQRFLDDLASKGGPPLYKLSPTEAREFLSNLQSGKTAKAPVDIKDIILSNGPKGTISLRMLRPQGNKDLLPVILYFHGGGWVLGDKDTHDRLIRELSIGANAALVFVNYSPAPEAQYPVQLEEAYIATQWVADNATLLNVDPSRIAVVGDSVGGNMATVIAMLAKERGGPKIIYQVLFYPVTDANFDTPSYQQFGNGYYLTKDAMKWFWDSYLPNQAARNKPTASPLRATIDQLKGMPPALIITDECDVLRDEGEAYARKLMEAGVPVTAVRFLGITHDFVMLNALENTAAARGAMELAKAMLDDKLNPD